jgi:hypothetical protein
MLGLFFLTLITERTTKLQKNTVILQKNNILKQCR